MNIVVTKSGTEIASGTLTVDTSTTPPTGTFTPNNNGTAATANVTSWSSAPNGATNWSFQVSVKANGNFPLGPNGNQWTYSFTGNENANGTNPSGNVTWPPSLEGTDPVTWQGDATAGDDEPYSRTQGAS